jgi:GT2 family glycosyltransferase
VTAPPLISVVIPTYNRPASLAACLTSFLQQDYPDGRWELVIVNDGGAPPWQALPEGLLARLPMRMIEAEHRGPAAARNLGVRQAQGSLIAFTDDDCRGAPDWLSQWAQGFSAGPWHALAGRTLNPFPRSLGSRSHHYLTGFLCEYMRFPNQDLYLVVANNAAFRREAFESLGGFDESFAFATEDRELSHRLAARGFRAGYWPQASIWHDHPLTLWQTLRLQFRYGGGDDDFRRALIRQGTPRQLGQRRRPQFYLALARALWRDRQPAPVWLLIGLSQLAHRIGSVSRRLQRSFAQDR